MLTLAILYHLRLLITWLALLVRCELYFSTWWCCLLLEMVFVPKAWGADHNKFWARVKRLHIVKRLGITLLVIESLSSTRSNSCPMASWLFVVCICIQFDHFLLSIHQADILEKEIIGRSLSTLRKVLEKICSCVCLRYLIIPLQMIIGCRRKARLRVSTYLMTLRIIFIVKAKKILKISSCCCSCDGCSCRIQIHKLSMHQLFLHARGWIICTCNLTSLYWTGSTGRLMRLLIQWSWRVLLI